MNNETNIMDLVISLSLWYVAGIYRKIANKAKRASLMGLINIHTIKLLYCELTGPKSVVFYKPHTVKVNCTATETPTGIDYIIIVAFCGCPKKKRLLDLFFKSNL